MAGQLAMALEGKALQVLQDVSSDQRQIYDALAAALERRFQSEKPRDRYREQLLEKRHPGERLGAVTADVLFMAKEGFPDFPAVVQQELALQSFLTAENLQQQVRLTARVSLEQALAQAKWVKAVLHRGSRSHPPTWTYRAGAPAEEDNEEETTVCQIRTTGPRRNTRCWCCRKLGHLERNCHHRQPPTYLTSRENSGGAA
ncbi:UNVERIFIED_CONTAM: hypothetical protein FKN15_053060 [Acipenser sinensis]